MIWKHAFLTPLISTSQKTKLTNLTTTVESNKNIYSYNQLQEYNFRRLSKLHSFKNRKKILCSPAKNKENLGILRNRDKNSKGYNETARMSVRLE